MPQQFLTKYNYGVVFFHNDATSEKLDMFTLVAQVFSVTGDVHLPQVGFASVNIDTYPSLAIPAASPENLPLPIIIGAG
jgi:hypothetical protein